jgi:hypothetical protein
MNTGTCRISYIARKETLIKIESDYWMYYTHKKKKVNTHCEQKWRFSLDFNGPGIFVFVGNFRMRQAEVM